MKTLKVVILLLLLFPLSTLSATLVSTSLKMDVTRPFEGRPSKLTSYKRKFLKQVSLVENKNYTSCAANKSIPKNTPDRMKVWWSYMVLNCTTQGGLVLSRYHTLAKVIDSHISLVNEYKGSKDYLAINVAKVLIRLSERKSYVLTNKEREFLLNHENILSAREKAKLYNYMAAINRDNKKMKEAANFYNLAYQVSKESKYATRLKTTINKNPELAVYYSDFMSDYKFKKEESKKVHVKFNRYYNGRMYLSAIKEAVKIINKEEGVDKKIIKKVFNILRKKLKKNFKKNQFYKQSMKCKEECLYQIGQRFYNRHKYKLSMAYVESVKTEFPEQLLLRGKINLQLGKYGLAEKYLAKSIELNKSRDKTYFETVFRLGLLKYRLKKYNEAVKVFAGNDRDKELNKFNLQLNYWYWRSLQKVSSNKANTIRDRVIKLYPLTYYGLRANQEKNNGQVILPTNHQVFQKKMKWSVEQKVSWENYKDFVEVQLFYLARKELNVLFDKNDDLEAVLFSYYSSLAADHYGAIKTINIVWNKDPNKYFNKSTIKLSVPVEYDRFVRDYSTKNNLEVNLVRSLIKQESSFRLKARSGSNAMGLMQLVPITTKDSAKYLRLNTKNIVSRVYEPELNVRLGTSYLRRLVRAFKGHIPLSLAAYNAGIGNIRRWMKHRSVDLDPLQSKNSSLPEDEVWIDELPWSETSFYVKAIMRNLVLYRFMYKGIKVIPDPTWENTETL